MVGDKNLEISSQVAKATTEAMRVIERAMRPGTTIADLQKIRSDVFWKMGVSLPESVFIFFHGLGLSHMDLGKFRKRNSHRTLGNRKQDDARSTPSLTQGRKGMNVARGRSSCRNRWS